MPFAALQSRVDAASAQSTWLLHPDGIIGRALAVAAGDTISYPLVLEDDVTFSGRAMLFPHDWRDLIGAVRASVTIVLRGGIRRELWSKVLAAAERGRPRGHEVRLVVPAETTALEFSVRHVGSLRPAENQVVRAVWVEPALFDGNAAPRLRALGAHPGARARRRGRPAHLGAHPGPRSTPAHARGGHRLRAQPDLPPLGAVPRRRRLHQPPDHHHPAAPRRLRPPHPPHPPRHRPRHLRSHQRRPHTRHRRLHRPPGPRRHPHPRRAATHRRPHRHRPHPRHALQRRGGDRRRWFLCPTHQTRMVPGAHERPDVHLPSRRLPAEPGAGAWRLSVAIRRLPGL